jgi:soluble lytic murein transglycosylase-like protein
MHWRYYLNLLRSVLGIRPLREWSLRPAFIVPCVMIVGGLAMGAFRTPGALGSIAGPGKHTAADNLMDRAAVVKHALKRVDHLYEDEVAPLARVLTTYRNDERLARRIATALVREGHRSGIAPDVLLAVLLVENPWINPSARSPVGARGLMQVMPGHQGQWKKCPASLDGIESNICYGAQIFRSYLREENGQVEAALLRYNGCVNGTNTPNCREYPAAVFARTGRGTLHARRVLHTHASD